MEKELRILIVEDVHVDAELEMRELKRAGLRVAHRLVETEEAFRSALKEFRPEIILSDFTMPHFDGMFALALARELAPDVPFIFVSGTIGEEYAIRALKNGATDYVLKNNLVRLPAAVERALQDAEAHAARKRAEEDQGRLVAIVKNSHDAIVSRGLDRKVTSWNAAAERLFGYTAAEIIGREGSIIIPPEAEAEVAQQWALLQKGRSIPPFDSVRLTKDDRRIDVSVSRSPINDASGKMIGVSLVFRDISKRKSHELKIARLSRIHAVLSGINSAIVRIRDRQKLFEEACRIAVEHGKFTMSWIGMLDEAAQAIRPVAKMGREEGYLERLNLTIGPNNTGNLAMAVEAVGRCAPVVCNDIATDGRMRPWRAAALERGYRSSAQFPLMLEQQAVGVFVLYAPEPGFFDEEEMKLLTELAGDISFALEHISGQEKIEKLSRIRVISSEINAAIVRSTDRQTLFNEACRIAVEQGRLGFAWIGSLDPATLDITPVAWAGDGSEEMRTTRSTARDDPPRGQGAVSRAIRERRMVFNNDLSLQSIGGPRLDAALKLGFRSMIALPLFEGDKVVGTFTLYAREPGFFDEDEIALLTELAGNVSFALEHMARQQRIEKLSRIRMVSGEINAAIVRIHDREALLRETCRIAAEHGKFELVWVALLDEEKKEVKPVAWTGFSEETARAANWASISTSKGTLGDAIQTRKPSVRNDIEAELPGGKLRQEALQKGCHSTVSLPLVVDDNVVALILLCAPGVGFFDTEELALLNEVAADISFALQTIEKQDKLDYLSYYDPLTGLPNRTLYLERLGQCLGAAGAGEQVVVMLGDVQRLRMINETFGRQAGDEILKQVAKRLSVFVRNSENLARVAADCFATFMPVVKDLGEIAHRMEKLRVESLRNPFPVAGRELTLAYTLGAAVYPSDGKDAESLLANAEAALRKAKDTGESLLFYEPSINARVAELLELENKLRQALEKEQFVLHYQPKIELASGRICGLEALIRWNDPETGLVPPMRFIPLLEETGMILEVGRWVIRKALEDYREWCARGLQPPRIAVNVSPIQLSQKNFVDVVRDAIGKSPAGSHGLDLEVTESLIMEDIEGNIAKLRAVRDMGVNIAIDDFGTGYSSLGYLAKLPVNALKIDRSFIITMANNADSMTIVSAIISLAHSLNLKVIAEGVDSEEQRNLLKLLRCDEMQGYLFSRPVPAAEVAAKYLAAAAA